MRQESAQLSHRSFMPQENFQSITKRLAQNQANRFSQQRQEKARSLEKLKEKRGSTQTTNPTLNSVYWKSSVISKYRGTVLKTPSNKINIVMTMPKTQQSRNNLVNLKQLLSIQHIVVNKKKKKESPTRKKDASNYIDIQDQRRMTTQLSEVTEPARGKMRSNDFTLSTQSAKNDTWMNKQAIKEVNGVPSFMMMQPTRGSR